MVTIAAAVPLAVKMEAIDNNSGSVEKRLIVAKTMMTPKISG